MAPENENPQSQEVLSQSDVEKMLAEMASSDAPAAEAAADPVKPFQRPPFIPEQELRKFRARQEDYARAMTARLSIYLRLEFGMQLSGITTTSFQQAVSSIASPSQLTLFKLDPLHGICFVEIPVRLALTMVDRLLGGPAHSVTERDKLSDIESALMDQTVELLLGEWCEQLRDVREMKPSLLGHEIDAHLLNSTPRETMVAIATFETSLGDCTDKFRIVFPYFTVEPVIRQINTPSKEKVEAATPATVAKPRWIQEFDSIPVPITAELKGLKLTAREVVNLKVGDTIPVDANRFNKVEVRLVKTPRFLGALGRSGQQWAVQLTKLLER